MPNFVDDEDPDYLDEEGGVGGYLNPRMGMMAPPANSPMGGPPPIAPGAAVQPPPGNLPPVDPSRAMAAQQHLADVMKARPQAEQPKWWQRIAAGAVGGLGGYVNAGGRVKVDPSGLEHNILFPGLDQKQAAWQKDVGAAQQQAESEQTNLKTLEDVQKGKSEQEYKAAEAERAKKQGASYEQRYGAQKELKKEQDAEKHIQNLLHGREFAYQPESEQVPPGYETIQDPNKPGYVYVVPPRFMKLPEDLVPYATGRKPGDVIPYSEFKSAQDKAGKSTLAAEAADYKTNPKAAFQQTMAKVAGEGTLSPQAMTDVKQLSGAISTSKAISHDERNNALAYLAANTTPASTGTSATIRMEGFTQRTPITVIDSKTNQALTMNMEDFNARNHEEPGRFVAAGTAVPAMQRQATFSDIQYNVDNARNSIGALGAMDAGTRAELANALSDESGGRLQTFLTGSVMATMTPQQRSAVISLRNLYENAFALRGVAGMGQGSDQLRHAILQTLPGAKSPDIPYMLEQIRQFEGIVQRLNEGTPRLGHNNPPAAPKPTQQPNPAVVSTPHGAIDLSQFHK